MNKLIIDNEFNVNSIVIDTDTDMVVDLDSVSLDITFHIAKGVCLKGFVQSKNSKSNFTYIVDEECEVVINKLGVDCSDNVTINLNNRNSRFKYNTSIINYRNNSYSQKLVHNFGENESKVTNHCINVLDNEFKFIVDGVVLQSANNVTLKQDNKIINLKNGKSNILPNLIVDNDDISASHSAFIGTFDEEKKFYMMSRGLTINECDDLLIKAFLLNDMDLTDKERDIFCSIIENINK